MARYFLISMAIGLPLSAVLAVLVFTFNWSGQAYNAGALVVIAISVTVAVLLYARDLSARR